MIVNAKSPISSAMECLNSWKIGQIPGADKSLARTGRKQATATKL